MLTLFIAAPPNGSFVWVRVVDEVSGAVFEQEITADLPAATQFLSPRLFMNTGAAAAAVAYDCAGVHFGNPFLRHGSQTRYVDVRFTSRDIVIWQGAKVATQPSRTGAVEASAGEATAIAAISS